MRRYLAVAVLAIGLTALGCAGRQKQEIGKDTMIKCPKCGVEFTVEEGMEKPK